MKKIHQTSLLIIFCVFLFSGVKAHAKDLVMIAPLIPPHFDAEGKGRIGDVIQAVLKEAGHTVRFKVVPFGRHWQDYKDDTSYDGLATAEADQIFPGYTTVPFHHLQDGATVLKKSALTEINDVLQLREKRIVTFPEADKILGIAHLTSQFASFSMRAERLDQVRPLLAERVDAILADGLITAHFLLTLRDRIKAGEEPDIKWNPVVYRRIFNKGPQRLYFRDKTITSDFDHCYQILKKRGDLDMITSPYIEKYREIVENQYPNY